MATTGNNRRGGQVYGTGPNWEIIKYEYQTYTPHRYDHAHEYDHVCLPKTTHTYEGHSYNKLRKWDEIRTYEQKEYKPNFYIAPRRKHPPSKFPPPKKPCPRNRDYQWATLYKCYEEPIGPERTVRVCPVNDYKNHDYNPAMTEFKGDKVMYMDRRFETYMYKGSVHYILTKRNFYPYSMLNKYEHQNDLNGNVTKEPTVTSLKEVNLHENTKNDQNAALVATVVVPVEDKDNTQIMADSSCDKEELKHEEPAPPLPVREETPKQTMSASHGVQAEDRLTPVNTVVAAGAIATLANTSDNKKDEIVESDKNEPKSDVQETSKTSNNKTNEPVYVAPVAAAAVVAPASTKTASPKPSRSGSASSVRSNKSIAGVPGGVALAGAVIASDMQPKNNPPPPQNNPPKDTKDEQKSPSENKEKVPSPAPVVPLVAAAVVGANASTTAPKQPTLAPKQEASQPSPTKSPSPSPPAAVAAPVAATAAAASQSAGPEATKKPTPEVPVQEQKNPVVETSNPQNAAKPSSPSKTNLPPEVIATIEAYDAAHDGNEHAGTQNSVGTVKRTIQLTS